MARPSNVDDLVDALIREHLKTTGMVRTGMLLLTARSVPAITSL
jgi:hypothetical protein